MAKLELIIAEINELVTTRMGNIVVYNTDGIFDSPIVIIAYLIKYWRMTVRKAVNHMASVRFGFNFGPKRSQLLLDIELKHIGSNSSKIKLYKRFGITGYKIFDFLKEDLPHLFAYEMEKSEAFQEKRLLPGRESHLMILLETLRKDITLLRI